MVPPRRRPRQRPATTGHSTTRPGAPIGHPPAILATAPGGQPSTVPTAPSDLAGSSTSALTTLPEVLTVPEAAATLRVGRNQLYQAIARGELGAVRIGRSIRIPKQALLDLLASANRPIASGDD